MADITLGGGVSGPLEVREYSSGAYAVGIWDSDSGFHVVALDIPTRELADLVAGAPDLLEACERLLTFNEELCADVGVSKHYPSADNARRVIAKARGA